VCVCVGGTEGSLVGTWGLRWTSRVTPTCSPGGGGASSVSLWVPRVEASSQTQQHSNNMMARQAVHLGGLGLTLPRGGRQLTGGSTWGFK
jgi:hypothetical protein